MIAGRTLRHYVLVLGAIVAFAAASLPSWAVSLAQEIDLGRKLDVEIMKNYSLSDNETGLKEIDEWGQNLVKGVRRTEIKYHFKILKDDELNAFSIPGGYVYFTDRLWNVLRKDEKIGVLGHEIVHIDGRHALDAISKQQRRQIWLTVLLTAVGANSTWGDIASLAESMYTLKYSRGDEQQADEFGVELNAKAGYNPAGMLLAMRKIKRFEDERGGSTPKIFSSHPPTKERLQYLERYLTNKGIPIPPEQVQTEPNPYSIGEVISAEANSVAFTSSKPLQPGDVVWLMGQGWDYYYETKTAVPIARAVVKTTTSGGYVADMWPMPNPKKGDITKGAGVYAPPMPAAEASVGTVRPTGRDGLGMLDSHTNYKAMDRFLARQVVWNKENTKLVYDSVGYLVITNSSSPTGYVVTTRPQFSYAPVEAGSSLIRLNDPDQDRWIGPVISIGRGGQTIEVMTAKTLDSGKTYEVAYPSWNSETGYAKRLVGTAKLQSSGKKIVLKMNSYSGAWGIADIRNGFDIYEASGAPAGNSSGK